MLGLSKFLAFSLVTFLVIFLFLVAKNEVYRIEDEHNHKLGSLFSFERSFDKLNSSEGMVMSHDDEDQFCPYFQAELRTDWNAAKTAYNVKDEIFLDWNIESFLFTYMHYKALESAFVSYPKASFSLLIVGPNAANYYKINDLISKHQFQKYKKRGYQISPVVVSSVKAPLGSSLTMHYWNLQELQYCSTKGKKKVHDVQTAPFHVWMYVRLHKLLASSGGISFDFSWLHMKPVDAEISAGFKMATVCTLIDHDGKNSSTKREVHLSPSSSLLHPCNETMNNQVAGKLYKDCYTSSFIVLRKRYMSDKVYERILMCMLTKYDEHASDGSGPLLDCFEKDVLTGGALCLQILLTDCFAQYSQNQLAPEPSARMLHLPHPSSGINKDVSSLLTFKWKSEVASAWQLQPLYSPVKSVLNCFVRNVFSFVKTMSSTYPDVISTCPTAYGLSEAGQDFALNFSNSSAADALHISAIWLGRNLGRKYSGNLLESQASKANVPFTMWESEKSTLDWFVPAESTMLHMLVNSVESRMCRPIGNIPISNLHRGTCTPFYSSVLSSTMPSATQRDTVLSRRNLIEERSRIGKACSINFVIPGFMKCASSFLFEALTNHPQVLRALKGVNFKETGCYLPPTKGVVRVDRPNHRMNCFPFIEKHESNYIYGDATVTYSTNFDVPFYFQRDNPNIKTIFAVRDPISRLESHFRFSLGLMRSLGFDTVDKAVSYLLRSDSSLHALRHEAELLLTDITTHSLKGRVYIDSISLEDCMSDLWVLFFRFDQCSHLLQQSGNNNIHQLHEKNKISLYISRFFVPGGAKTKPDRVTSLLARTSIYFPVIAHWSRVLRPENIYVVENEHLSLSSKKSRPNVVLELMKIHRFLNISEHDKSVPGQTVHKTVTGKGTDNASVTSVSSRIALKEFFSPFNELLHRLVDYTKIASYDINYNNNV